MAIPTDLNTLLRRGPCAAALTEAGYPISPDTLATKAVRGGGPSFRLFGRFPLYRWGDSLEWAQSRLGPLVRSTAEVNPSRQTERNGSEQRPIAKRLCRDEAAA